ncbi:MAG: hypothetical protein GKR88_21285 [Flavobacteriaceae bacterium]|nr:MAG: hypothetical protein GKR88_21285 [Flavobacteriaceae bacterium]
MNKLDTTNCNNYQYETKHLNIHILGGIKTNKLENLRVTLSVQKLKSSNILRHSIDLYNDNQVEKFARKIAERQSLLRIFFNRFIIFIIRRKKMLVARPRCSLNRSQTMCPRRLWRCAFAALVLRTTQNTQSALASINSTVKSKKGKYIVGYYPEMS